MNFRSFPWLRVGRRVGEHAGACVAAFLAGVPPSVHMHRGVHAFDEGPAASSSKSFKKKLELAAYYVPRWLAAAPQAAAKAYVLRLNSLAPEKQTAAALLFDVSPHQLEVAIPSSFAGFSIAQLQIPKGTVVRRQEPSAMAPPRVSIIRLLCTPLPIRQAFPLC